MQKTFIFKTIIIFILLITKATCGFTQISYESQFLKHFYSQSFAGKVNAFDTLKSEYKLRCFPLVKEEIQLIKEKALADNKTEILDRLTFIDGEMYFLNRNYYKSTPIFIDLLTKHKIKSFKDSCRVFVILKNAYIYTRALNKAIEAHKTLVELNKRNAKSDPSILDPALSTIYYEMKLYKESLQQQLLEYADIKKDSSKLIGFYNNRGLFWSKDNNQDSALACYNLAKKIFLNTTAHKQLTVDDKFVLGLIEGNIGQTLMTLNDYKGAIPLLKQDVVSSVNSKNYHNAAISQLELSRCYLQLNQLDLSKKYIDSANVKMASIDDYKSKLNIIKQYAVYYKKAGNLNESINYYSKYIKTKDSLDSQENMKELISTQVAYQMDQKEGLIIANQTKINQNNLEIVKQHSIKNVLITCGTILVVVIILVLFQLSKANNRKHLLEIRNKQIGTRNQIINKALVEKDLLIKEVHHRVKNNLQIISSLLKLQSGKSNNEEVKSSLFEAQERINSMALLHQLLYRNNEVTNLSFNNYLSNLIIQISNSFSILDKNIKIESHIIELELNLDTAIPLGLITNEIISNAYKHAFSAKEGGIISVSLTKIVKNTYQLKISDNGNGLPPNFDLSAIDSLGLDIVFILSEQINAELKIYNNNGANFEILFSV